MKSHTNNEMKRTVSIAVVLMGGANIHGRMLGRGEIPFSTTHGPTPTGSSNSTPCSASSSASTETGYRLELRAAVLDERLASGEAPGGPATPDVPDHNLIWTMCGGAHDLDAPAGGREWASRGSSDRRAEVRRLPPARLRRLPARDREPVSFYGLETAALTAEMQTPAHGDQTLLTGKLIVLRGLPREDMESYRAWLDNEEATHFMERAGGAPR